MTETSFINLTYTSPSEDIENFLSINPDGSINAKFTLLSMKGLLSKNLAIINKLIDESDHIIDIIPINYNLVEIKIDSTEKVNELIENETLINNPDTFSDEQNEEFGFDNLETNQDRYNMIKNLINYHDMENIFDEKSSCESDTDSDDDAIISDKRNYLSVLNKYSMLINESNIDSDDDEPSI